jgi:hypothetical protein
MTNGTKPTVGMGVTVVMWTDRYPGTIVRVSPSGKTFQYQEDKATRTDSNGMSESQTYRFEPNPAATVRTARLTKSGWKDKGTRIAVGVRSRYYDFSF